VLSYEQASLLKPNGFCSAPGPVGGTEAAAFAGTALVDAFARPISSGQAEEEPRQPQLSVYGVEQSHGMVTDHHHSCNKIRCMSLARSKVSTQSHHSTLSKLGTHKQGKRSRIPAPSSRELQPPTMVIWHTGPAVEGWVCMTLLLANTSLTGSAN
jgi:hypothetical protein